MDAMKRGRDAMMEGRKEGGWSGRKGWSEGSKDGKKEEERKGWSDGRKEGRGRRKKRKDGVMGE